MNAHVSAHEQLRSAINVIHSEHARLGIHSLKLDNATYSIETLMTAYVTTNEHPYDWGAIHLTAKQREIADLLRSKFGKCITRESIMAALYSARPDADEPDIKIIDVLVCKLRKVLVGSGFWIKSEWGVGYRMLEGESPNDGQGPRMWEGLLLGWRVAGAAELLKSRLGQIVPYAEFGQIHSTTYKNIVRLKGRLAGSYTIDTINGVGYRMRPVIPQPVSTALRKLVA